MNCQSLLSGENNKNISKCCLLNFLPTILSIKIGYIFKGDNSVKYLPPFPKERICSEHFFFF